MKNWLENKTIVITGASSGLGKDMTKMFISKYNCKVIGVARNEEKLKNLKNEISPNDDKFEYVQADVSKKEDWEKIYSFTKNKNCTLLINNAGTMLPFQRADKVEDFDIERIFKTNLFSAIYGYKTFCKDFRKNSNCGIVNIASIAAIAFLPGTSYYSATKSALASFSKIIACEERKKFFVGTYYPGTARTNLFKNKDNKKDVLDDKAESFLKHLSMSSEKMAKKIVKAIAKRKKCKSFGVDSGLLRFLTRLMPVKSSDLCLTVFKKSKLETFEEIFN